MRPLLLVALVACTPAARPITRTLPAEPANEPPPPIVVAPELASELASGVGGPIDLRVPGARGALVGHCAIAYDPWDDVWVVEQDGVRTTHRARQAALQTCIDRGALRRARLEAAANRRAAGVYAERRELPLAPRGHDRIWCGSSLDERVLRE